MPTVNLDQTSQLLFQPGYGSVLVVNNDDSNTAWVDTATTVSAASIPIAPQGSVTLDGATAWYGSSRSTTTVVEALILPGGTEWSNPVGVSAALSALGLATYDEQVSQSTDIPANIQTMGAPPFIPGLKCAALSQMSAAGSPYTLATFSGNSRIWYASLSFAVSTDASYSAGPDGPFAELYIQTIGQIILICQVAINAPDQASNSDQSLSFGGIEVASGDSVFVNVNNGNAITGALIRAGAVMLSTTP